MWNFRDTNSSNHLSSTFFYFHDGILNFVIIVFPVETYVYNKKTARIRWETWSELLKKPTECHWQRSDVFIVNNLHNLFYCFYCWIVTDKCPLGGFITLVTTFFFQVYVSLSIAKTFLTRLFLHLNWKVGWTKWFSMFFFSRYFATNLFGCIAVLLCNHIFSVLLHNMALIVQIF